MSLTKKEKQRILEACESIDTDRVSWSCWAIQYINFQEKKESKWSYHLAEKYRYFYFELPYRLWPKLHVKNTREMRDHRIMLLLLFLAADGVLK